MRFNRHDEIYRLRHTSFFSIFFRAGGRRADFFFRVGGRHADSENAELAGKPSAELAGKPNAELAGKQNAGKFWCRVTRGMKKQMACPKSFRPSVRKFCDKFPKKIRKKKRANYVETPLVMYSEVPLEVQAT